MVAFAPTCQSHRPAKRVGDEDEVVGLGPCWLWQVVGMKNNRGKTARSQPFPRWLCWVVFVENGGSHL